MHGRTKGEPGNPRLALLFRRDSALASLACSSQNVPALATINFVCKGLSRILLNAAHFVLLANWASSNSWLPRRDEKTPASHPDRCSPWIQVSDVERAVVAQRFPAENFVVECE